MVSTVKTTTAVEMLRTQSPSRNYNDHFEHYTFYNAQAAVNIILLCAKMRQIKMEDVIGICSRKSEYNQNKKKTTSK